MNVNDPIGTIGGYSTYKAESCPQCGEFYYTEWYGNKMPMHVCRVDHSVGMNEMVDAGVKRKKIPL